MGRTIIVTDLPNYCLSRPIIVKLSNRETDPDYDPGCVYVWYREEELLVFSKYCIPNNKFFRRLYGFGPDEA